MCLCRLRQITFVKLTTYFVLVLLMFLFDRIIKKNFDSSSNSKFSPVNFIFLSFELLLEQANIVNAFYCVPFLYAAQFLNAYQIKSLRNG